MRESPFRKQIRGTDVSLGNISAIIKCVKEYGRY